MAKLLGTFGAVERFVWVRDPVDHVSTAFGAGGLPVIHCCHLASGPR